MTTPVSSMPSSWRSGATNEKGRDYIPPERVIALQRLAKRLLALLLAALLAVGALTATAFAEDWRDQLRQAFGLEEESPTATPKPTRKADKKTKKATATPKPTRTPKKQDTGPITDPQEIVNYLAKYGKLPDNFITKKEARALGWDSYYNYVGDVAPGKSIGGDYFGNYDGKLPTKKGRKWYECDTGYKGKKRTGTRLLFSNDGLYYYSSDHYNTFTQMYPEE